MSNIYDNLWWKIYSHLAKFFSKYDDLNTIACQTLLHGQFNVIWGFLTCFWNVCVYRSFLWNREKYLEFLIQSRYSSIWKYNQLYLHENSLYTISCICMKIVSIQSAVFAIHALIRIILSFIPYDWLIVLNIVYISWYTWLENCYCENYNYIFCQMYSYTSYIVSNKLPL